MKILRFALVATLVTACLTHGSASPTSVGERVAIIHSFTNGLVGVRANPAVQLRVSSESARAREPILIVEYPPPNGDPAFRDVHLDAERTSWSEGRALGFDVRPSHTIRLSISFIDRHRVVYTAWTNLRAETWQKVRIELASIRPNPYFQLPDAESGAPLDVSEVRDWRSRRRIHKRAASRSGRSC